MFEGPEQFSSKVEKLPTLSDLAEEHEEVAEVMEQLEENLADQEMLKGLIAHSADEIEKEASEKRLLALEEMLGTIASVLVKIIIDIGIEKIGMILTAAAFDGGDSPTRDLSKSFEAHTAAHSYVNKQIERMRESR